MTTVNDPTARPVSLSEMSAEQQKQLVADNRRNDAVAQQAQQPARPAPEPDRAGLDRDITDNEALRGAFRQMIESSAEIAAAVEAAENALAAMKESAAVCRDAVDGKRFDGNATQSVRALAEVVSTMTMSDWAEANENMRAAAQSGLGELAKWLDDEDLVAANNIDPTTLAATNS